MQSTSQDPKDPKLSSMQGLYLSVTERLRASIPIVQELQEPNDDQLAVERLMWRLTAIQQQGEQGLKQLEDLSGSKGGEGADMVKAVEGILEGLRKEIRTIRSVIGQKKGM